MGTKFKKGDCIVRVSRKGYDYSINFPVDYCFKFKEYFPDSGYVTHFGANGGLRVYKDCTGNENGWADNLFRKATLKETNRYHKEGKPYSITTFEQVLTNYEVYD